MGTSGSSPRGQREVAERPPEEQLAAATGYRRDDELRSLVRKCGEADGQDFYALFGLNRYCHITEEIKGQLNQKFKELMLRWHPDRNKTEPRDVCHVWTVKIALARKVLQDAKLKSRYDNELRGQIEETKKWSSLAWYLKWGYNVTTMMGGLALIIAGASGSVVSGGTTLAVASAGGALLASGINGSATMRKDPKCSTGTFAKSAGIGALLGAATGAGGEAVIAAEAAAGVAMLQFGAGAATLAAAEIEPLFQRIARKAPDLQHRLVKDAKGADFILSRTNVQKEEADEKTMALLREGFRLCADSSLAGGWGGEGWVRKFVEDASKTKYGVLVLEFGDGFFHSKPCCDELYAAKAAGLNLTKVHGNIKDGQYFWVQITDQVFPTPKAYEREMRARHRDWFTPHYYTVEMGPYYKPELEGHKYTYYCVLPHGRAAAATGADRQKIASQPTFPDPDSFRRR